MYTSDYLFFMLALVACMIFSGIVSRKVHTSFARYDQFRASSGMTGSDTVRALMAANGVYGISIGHVSGELTDHYHPTKSIVNLSDSTYGSSSVAAVAVAAHEVGHVMQRQRGYFLYQIRSALVPVVNLVSRLAMPLVLVGLLLDYLALTADPELGFYIAMIGVLFYGGSLLFALVTLPVELDASRRASQMLLSEGILTQEEMYGAKKVLSAAALTYLASLLTALVSFLRFLFYVLALFGRRDNRR